MVDLDDFVRGTSHLYEAVKERYIQLTGETVPLPEIPLLLDKPLSDLPSDISNKMEAYRVKLIAGMESHPSEARAYLNTALYTVFQATFCTDISSELHDQYADAADPVYNGMYTDTSIDDFLMWIADTMPVPK